MRRQHRTASTASWLLILATLTACSATGADPDRSAGSDASGSGGQGSSTDTGAAGSGAETFGTGGGSSAPTNGDAEVYGHSADTLYRLDPTTKAVTVVGAFAGCSDVTDIALDRDSKMIATTKHGLYAIDTATAACTLIHAGDYPNSLSFVPQGTVDPGAEALVGYLDSTYVRIDPTSGAVSAIGELGDWNPLESEGFISSGDIVSVKGGKTLLTVYGPGCFDCIVEVDPTTGALLQNLGPLGYQSVYGLAFWAGSAYAFTDGGALLEVTFTPSLGVTALAIPMAPGDLSFWGAGSTTSAPPNAVPK